MKNMEFSTHVMALKVEASNVEMGFIPPTTLDD